MIICGGLANPSINQNTQNRKGQYSPIDKYDTKQKPKKSLPVTELINRRKSPALWREDLNNDSNPQSVPWKPTEPPEIMSPVGGWPQLYAAIANGADSIYLGLSSYSARARATNFDTENLFQAVETCHASNVKVYVALNTLVFNHELSEVEELVQICMEAKVDALIIQDLGVAIIVQEILDAIKLEYESKGIEKYHMLEVHASTQQTVTSADGVKFAWDVGGATRVVLGRELSVKEIQSVTSSVGSTIQVEAFVHGALCVSYSGQCFSSEAWGGRSANRGQCAQACRLPYGLIKDGTLIDLQDMSYLLSPQDLCGLDQVPDLVKAGISCLKIEGRLKDAAYVAATTRAYRNAVDKAWNEYINDETQKDSKATKERTNEIQPITRKLSSQIEVTKGELVQLFARAQDENHDGLTPGFFEGSQHQMLVRGRSPRHRGTHIGHVHSMSSWKRGLYIILDKKDDKNMLKHLKLGDGIVVDRGMPQEEELGGPIYDIQTITEKSESENQIVIIRFGRNVEKKWKLSDDKFKSKFSHNVTPLAPPGAHVWKTSDANVDKKMRKLVDAATPQIASNSDVTIHVSGGLNQPLQITIKDLSTGFVGVGISDEDKILVKSNNKGLDEKSIRKAIGLLGGTQWAAEKGTEMTIDVSGLAVDLWCPVSWVKEVRRRAVEDLMSQSDKTIVSNDVNDGTSALGTVPTYSVTTKLLKQAKKEIGSNDNKEESTKMHISVLARNLEQVDALCQIIDDTNSYLVDEIIIDFLEIDGMRQAISIIRESKPNLHVVVASPRIIKAQEEGIWRTLLRLEPDGLLIRSAGLLYRMIELGGAGATVNIGGEEKSEKNLVTIPNLIGDFSLNAVNTLTARELLHFGLSRITAAYDLNANAITEIAKSMGGNGAQNNLEVIAHAHLPIFHTEHCVFARFLSKGNSYIDCGHVCTRHTVHLRDESGEFDNLVLADMGCRNTVFAAQAQSGVHSIKEWKNAGIGRIRIELVDEGPSDVALIINGYNDVLMGNDRAGNVWDALHHVRDSNGRMAGVTHGSLRNTVERRAGEL